MKWNKGTLCSLSFCPVGKIFPSKPKVKNSGLLAKWEYPETENEKKKKKFYVCLQVFIYFCVEIINLKE